MNCFSFPESCAFGRVLPKNKIYEHGKPGTAVKKLFVRQVEQIVWQYKLAPETVNLKGTRHVPEIQVFGIALKSEELKTDVLCCIDRAIPFPILFELRYGGKIKGIAAYKRPSESDGTKWVLGDYFETDWMPDDMARDPLPIVFDLEALYESLLRALMPFPSFPGEGLQASVERMEHIRTKQREVEKCEARLRKEKQFNRKVQIHSELRELKHKLENLIRPSAAIVK